MHLFTCYFYFPSFKHHRTFWLDCLSLFSGNVGSSFPKWCPSSTLSLSAFEVCMPSTSKVGPSPAGAQDRPLRPCGPWRHCGSPSIKGEGRAEGRAEGGGKREGEEGWDQPHHPGKQWLHQHTQQPQPQRIDATPLYQHYWAQPLRPTVSSFSSSLFLPFSSILTPLSHSPLWGRSHSLETFTYCKGLLFLS